MTATPETKLETVAEFVARCGIKANTERVPENPHNTGDEWAKSAFHWSVTLYRTGLEGGMFRCYFSQGAAHVQRKPFRPFQGVSRQEWETCPKPGARGLTVNQAAIIKQVWEPAPPTAEDLLGSLLMDAQSYDNTRDFEDWAADMGGNADSRKLYAVWQATAENMRRLRAFLGRDLYPELLACEAP